MVTPFPVPGPGDVWGQQLINIITEHKAEAVAEALAEVVDPASETGTALNATILDLGGEAFEGKAFTPPITYSPVPGALSGKSQYSGVSYNQDAVSSGDGFQYAGWYDDLGALIIGKRKLPAGRWSTFSLSTIAGNPLVLPVDNDPHNNVSLIVDALGYIHVAANMHGDVLRYVRSTSPHDITAWTAPGMVGTDELQVTYPRFALHSDGTLFFLYRDGASGFGDLFMNKWNGTAWTRVGKIADGKTTSENPYESRFVVGRDGSLNLAITWRPNGGDANSNNDVHFIRSADKGVTWKSVSGTVVAMPLVHANTTALALDTAASGSGIINQFGLDTDADNRPHIALQISSGAGPDRNIHHLWWNGTAWVNDQATDLQNTMGLLNWTTRPTVACTNDGRTLITYTTRRFGPVRGTFRLVDVTGGTNTEVPLSELEMHDIEPTYDGRALRERGELHFLLSQANADVNAPHSEYWHVSNWDRQWGGVLTVDLAQIGSVLRREARPLRIKTVQTIAVPTNAAVTNTATAAVTASIAALTTPDMRLKPAFVRLTARASTTGGTLTVQAFEAQQSGSNRVFGAIPFTTTSTALKATPWMPLAYGPILGAESLIQVHAYVSATFTGTISAATLEIGVLDGPVN